MSSYGNPPENPYGQQPGDQPSGQYAAPYGQPGQQQGYGMTAAPSYSAWPKRVGAFLIDALLILVASIPIYIGAGLAAGSVETSVDPATGMTEVTGGGMTAAALVLYLIGFVLYLAVFIWNVCLRQGRTGYSVGKQVLGIKLIKEQTGQPIGAGMSFVRQIAHILDSLPCYIGYLWPLWDSKRQTFADKVVGTIVIDQPKG